MIFKAVSDVSTPPDFTATIIFGDVKKPTDTFTISRAAEIPPEGQIHYKLYMEMLLAIVAVKAHEAVVHKADEKSGSSRSCKWLQYNVSITFIVFAQAITWEAIASKAPPVVYTVKITRVGIFTLYSIWIIIFHRYHINLFKGAIINYKSLRTYHMRNLL